MLFRRESLVNKAIRRSFCVTLTSNEGAFAGILTEFDDVTYVFECCKTVPSKAGETARDIPGRIFVDRINVAYLQEVNV